MNTKNIAGIIALLALTGCAVPVPSVAENIIPQGIIADGPNQGMNATPGASDTVLVPGDLRVTVVDTMMDPVSWVIVWDSTTAEILKSAPGGLASPGFGIVAVPSGTNPTATVPMDTLTLALTGGATNSITGDSGTNTVTFGIHDPVTLSTDLSTNLLSLTTQQLGLPTRPANYIFAG